MKGPAAGGFHGGAIDVPPHTSVFFTYALIDDVNDVERRFTVD